MEESKTQNKPIWLTYYENQITNRNMQEVDPFQELVAKYQFIMNKLNIAQEKAEKLEMEHLHMKASKQMPEVVNLNEKIRKLESEVTGHYKEQKESKEIELEMTKQVKELEYGKRDIEMALKATNEKLIQNQVIIRDRTEENLKIMEEVETLRKQNKGLEDNNKHMVNELNACKKENGDLILRICQEKDTALRKLDEANDLFNEALKMREKAGGKNKKLKEEEKKVMDIDLSAYSAGLLSYSIACQVPTRPKHKINAHKSETTTLAYDPLGSKLATGGGDNIIKIWDTNSGNEISAIKVFSKPITSLSFNLEGSLLAAASTEKVCKIINMKTERAFHSFMGHTDTINACSFCLRSQKVLTGGSDRTIRIWDVQKNMGIKTITCFSSCFGLDTSTEDTMAISGHMDGKMRIWSILTGQMMHEVKDIHQDIITSINLSNDNQYALTNSKDNSLCIVDLRQNKVLKRLEYDDYCNMSNTNRAVFSGDNKYVVVGGNKNICSFDWEKGEVDDVIEEAHGSRILGCAWQPRGAQFASCDDLGGLIIWE